MDMRLSTHRLCVICVLLCGLSRVLGASLGVRIASSPADPAYNRSAATATPGQFSKLYFPSFRAQAAIWRDNYLNLVWLMGGRHGPECGGTGGSDDLWKYDLSLFQWAYVYGNTESYCTGCQALPPIGQTGWPSPRWDAFVQPSATRRGMAYIFGGFRSGPTGSTAALNQLWEFNSTSVTFTYLGPTPEGCGNPGTSHGTVSVPGSYSLNNYPAQRVYGSSWYGSDDTFYSFGGVDDYVLNDLWGMRRTPSGATWKLLTAQLNVDSYEYAGPSYNYPPALPWYQDSPSLKPLGRVWAIGVTDDVYPELQWMYGGESVQNGNIVIFNIGTSELWRFNTTSGLWAFFGGFSYNGGPSAWATNLLNNSDLDGVSGWPGPRYCGFAMIHLRGVPGVAYMYGVRPGDVWALVTTDVTHPVWVWIGGAAGASSTIAPDPTMIVGGGFVQGGAVPSVSTVIVPVDDYSFMSVAGDGYGASDSAYNVHITVLSPTWVVQPSPASEVGITLSVQPSLYVVTLPSLYTAPVNFVNVTLTAVGSAPSVLSGNTVTVVNGWANFTSLTVYRPGTFVFQLNFGVQPPYTLLSNSTTATCSTGCDPNQCTNRGVTAPACGRCDYVNGWFYEESTRNCVHGCPTGEYYFVNETIKPIPLQTCKVCVTGCAACTAPTLRIGALGCQTCDNNGFIRGLTECIPVNACPIGTYPNLAPPEHICDPCSPGCGQCTALGLTSDVCQLCRGSFVSLDNSSCQIQCPPGQYGSNDDKRCHACTYGCARCTDEGIRFTTCQQCDQSVGFLRNPFAGACVDECDAGEFDDHMPIRSCQACQHGCAQCTNFTLSKPQCQACDQPSSVLDPSGQTCVPECPPGFYKNEALSPMQCSPCTTGCAQCTSASLMKPYCTACDEALNYTLDGSTCVTHCQNGYYNERAGIDHCAVCNAACYNCTDPTLICSTCNDGFPRDPTSGACSNPCPRGKMPSADGNTCEVVTCSIADSTTYVAATSDPGCANTAFGQTCYIQCAAGFQGQATSSLCGQLFDNAGGVFTSDTLPSCTPCPVNFYNPDVNGQCQACVGGETHDTGAASIEDCSCLVGYYESVKGSHVCVGCPPNADCAGDTTEPVSKPGYYKVADAFIECQPSSACTGANICAAGYTGNQCAACANRYYRLTGQCVPCGNDTAIKIAAGVILATIACALLIYIARPAIIGQQRFAIATPTIVLSCIQVTATFGSVRLPWPENLKRLFDVFSSLNFNIEIVNPDCVTAFGFYDKFQVLMIVPIIVMLLFVLGFVVAAVVIKVRNPLKEAATHQITVLANNIGAGFVLFLNLAYLFLADNTLSFFACQSQADGRSVLGKAPDIYCYEPEWYRNLPLAIAGIILYIVSIPVIITGSFLYLSRKYGRHVALSGGLLNFMVVKYRDNVWFWEFAIIIRKFFIVLVTAMVVQSPIIAAVLIILIMFVALIVTLAVRPYYWDKHDMAEVVSIVTSLLVLFAGVVCASGKIGVKGRATIDGLIVALVVIAFLVFAGALLLEIYIKYVIVFRRQRIADKRARLEGHTGTITALHLAGERLFSADATGNLRSWNAETLDVGIAVQLESPAVAITALDFGHIVVATANGALSVYNNRNMELVLRTTPPTSIAPLRAICLVQGCVATGHEDGRIIFYRPEHPNGVMTLSPVANQKATAAIKYLLCQGEDLFVGLDSGNVVKWHVSVQLSVDVAARWSVARHALDGMAIWNDLLFVAAGSTVQAFDLKTSAPRWDFPNDASGVSVIAISEGLMFSGTWSGRVNVWDNELGVFSQSTPGKQQPITAIASTSSTFFTGDAAGSIDAWNIKGADDGVDVDPVRRRWVDFKKRQKIKRRPLLSSDFVVGQNADDSLVANAAFDPEEGGSGPLSGGIPMKDFSSASVFESNSQASLLPPPVQSPSPTAAAFHPDFGSNSAAVATPPPLAAPPPPMAIPATAPPPPLAPPPLAPPPPITSAPPPPATLPPPPISLLPPPPPPPVSSSAAPYSATEDDATLFL